MYSITYQNVDENQERKIAIVAASLSISFLLIAACFIRLFIQAPLPKDLPPLRSDEVIEEFVIDNVEIAQTGGHEGGGTENNQPLNPVKTTNPNTVQGNDFKGPPVNGNNTGNNPFGTGGTGGGTGTGNGPFNGDGNGTGEGGNGTGTGTGDGRDRVRLNDPILPKYKTDIDIFVHLKLIINGDGKVVSATNITSKTTTTDQRIINGVISEVVKQVKYKQEKNAGLQFTFVTCKIRAQ
jgi:hypothetical protein